jgi:RNA polymerase sigma factor (sigma-70 family)
VDEVHRLEDKSMAEAASNPFLRHLRHLIGTAPATGLNDGQLLERFLADRDETAVEVLVRRYGPLVFGVCRRVLRDAHAAEDAFQATFLVLVRKAPALDRGKPLGSWLCTVAYRLALSARTQQLRRQRREAQAAQTRLQAEDWANNSSDLVVTLDEELHRLPERHRTPLVLCYFEGKTNEQAAQILGCPVGSMSARLAQARERLRQCLARRGFVAPAAGLAAALATEAQAAVPLPLLDNAVRAAVWFAGERSATAGVVSAQAVALARGACRAMFVHKLQIAAAVLLAVGMLGTGATLLLRAAPQANPPAPAEAPPPGARPEHAEAAERLPEGVVARMGTTQLRHGDTIFFAAYTPDGKALLTAGRDGAVRLWDLASAKEIRRFDWGEGGPDGKAEPFEEEMPQRWEHQLWGDLAISSQAALSADDKVVAASRGGVVCLWETATGKKLGQLQTGQSRLDQLTFSADGKSLLTLGPGHATAVWEVATGRCIRHRDGKREAGFRVSEFAAVMEQVALVSPGWKYLAFRKQADNDGPWSIRIKELATGKELFSIETVDGRAPLTFTPDGRTLVWARFEGGIVFSDVATGQELRRLGGGSAPPDMATNFAFSADGRSLAVSRLSRNIELWDLYSGKLACRVTHLAQRRPFDLGALARPALAFSPDGKRLLCTLGGAAVRQFQADSGAEIPGPDGGHRASVSTLTLSADGKSVWTYGRGDPVRCWDWATGKQTGQRGVPAGATLAAFAADGGLAFADGKSVTVCGADGKQTRTLPAVALPLVALALSADGAVLATRSLDNPAVHLWDTTTLDKRHTLAPAGDALKGSNYVVTETAGVVTPDLVFSPDGRCLAGAGPRRQLCLWDVATGTLLGELPPQDGQAIERFAFSPRGVCLAAVHADRTVTLYETRTGVRRGRLGTADPKKRRLHLTFSYNGGSGLMGARRDTAVCLAFSPSGRYLAVAQETPQIHVWDVLSGREVGQLQGHEGGVISLLFAPDGRHLFSGGTDTTALTWDLARLIQPGPARAARLEPASLDVLWTDLAGQDATRAFEAIRKLSAVPDQAVALIQQRVRPAALPDPERLARLLADLGSDRFEVRRQAESELAGLAELAEPALRQALADEPPLDLRKRLERLLDSLSGQVRQAGQLRDLRAIELLEFLGTPAAQQVLATLGGGVPTARLTREAKSAMHRLAQQTAQP